FTEAELKAMKKHVQTLDGGGDIVSISEGLAGGHYTCQKNSDTLREVSGYHSNAPETISDVVLAAGLPREQASVFGKGTHAFLAASEPGLISVTPSELAPLLASAYPKG
ncbi:MAG: hypothetical protein H5U25_03915, partial [Oceanibaculum nanhaiense]|nr:hypothetical protein [Oceanibaculum nanhaiense]